VPVRAPRKIAQPHSSNLDPHEAKHLRADRTEQATDPAVFAFVQDHFEPGVARAGTARTRPSMIRASACVRERNASFDRARGKLITAPL